MDSLHEYAPDLPFSEISPPPAPDYDDIANPWVWVAWPGRESRAENFRVAEEPVVREQDRPCDCFFIHPTTSIPFVDGHPSKIWNARYDCPAADSVGFATTQGVAGTQVDPSARV